MNNYDNDLKELFVLSEREFSNTSIPKYRMSKSKKIFAVLPLLIVFVMMMVLVKFQGVILSESIYSTMADLYSSYEYQIGQFLDTSL